MVGGGNTAAEEALFLTNFADKVTLIHRRDSLRADKTNQMRLAANKKIEIALRHRSGRGAGHQRAQGRHRRQAAQHRDRLAARDRRWTGCSSPSAIRPRPSLFKGKLDMDESGYIKTAPDSTHTSVAGVFAAGDVKDKVFRQAVTAAGMGCMAALEAERFLAARTEEICRCQRLTAGGGNDGLGQASHLPRRGQRGKLHPCRPDAAPSASRRSAARSAPWKRKSPRPLFQRHARGLTLTDEGELLYGAVSDVLARLAAAEEALKNIHDSPRGSLKITASHGIGAYWLLPRLKRVPEGISGSGSPSGDGRPRAGPVAARGRPRHPHARAGAGRPDPAQALHRALSHVRVEEVSGRASGAAQRWKISATTPSSSMARRRRRRSATSTGCWSCSRRTSAPAAPAASSASTTSPASCRRWKRAWGSAWCRTMSPPSIRDLVPVLPEVPAPGFDVHLVYADALAPIQAGGGLPRLPGQGFQGLAVLKRFPGLICRAWHAS